MKGHSSRANPITELPRLSGFAARVQPAVELLHEGAVLAADLGCPRHEFSVAVADLLAAGLTANALRWLVRKGLVQVVRRGGGVPRRSEGALRGSARLILAAPGLALARSLPLGVGGAAAGGGRSQQIATTVPPQVVPVWDAASRTLWVGGAVVKRFRVPAANQELVLSAFQEEAWPVSIFDPLQPAPGPDAKRRLHDTINRLNRNQKHRLLHFAGNGNGQSIRWELARSG